MKFVFIVPDETVLPSSDLMAKFKKVGVVEVIKHKGKLAQLDQLKNDSEDKILAVDPDSFEWDLDAGTIKDFPRVKAVMTSSTSFDWVKPQTLESLGVKVCNIPGFSSDSVAEYALGMAIDISRKLPIIIKNGWKVDWDYSKPSLLKGKTVGVVGLGRIGKNIAQLCQGIGMTVVYWSKNSTDERFKKVELEELFKTADVIIPALVENSQTKEILTKQIFDLMKPSSVLVGINRVKAIWDEDSILEKVKKGEIAGYAFEGDNANDINSYEGNVLPLPAVAWYTQESIDNLMKIWIENMIVFAKGKPQNVVN